MQLTVVVVPLFLCPLLRRLSYKCLLLINKLINIFEFPSHVQDQTHQQYFTPYPETYQHKDPRINQQRDEDRNLRTLFSSDSDDDDSSASLQELDFSSMASEQQDYSIEHFIENLQAEGSYL